VLTVEGLDRALLAGALGAIIGIGFIYSTRAISGTADLDLNRTRETSLEYGYKVVLLNSLHSASEGVAIGVAMVVSLELGIFMALALAVHNIPEATTLCAVLRSRGVRLGDAVGLAVTTNVSQVLLAVITFAIVSAAPAVLSWSLGFAIGALIYLVMVDLLPESYRRAGHTSIALLTSVAMGVVVLLKGFLA
ncbi:MAG: ZIP family metal transporter, partial [Anaerolineae bacterium]